MSGLQMTQQYLTWTVISFGISECIKYAPALQDKHDAQAHYTRHAAQDAHGKTQEQMPTVTA
jgi:hypothetical protein